MIKFHRGFLFIILLFSRRVVDAELLNVISFQEERFNYTGASYVKISNSLLLSDRFIICFSAFVTQFDGSTIITLETRRGDNIFTFSTPYFSEGWLIIEKTWLPVGSYNTGWSHFCWDVDTDLGVVRYSINGTDVLQLPKPQIGKLNFSFPLNSQEIVVFIGLKIENFFKE